MYMEMDNNDLPIMQFKLQDSSISSVLVTTSNIDVTTAHIIAPNDVVIT